MNCCRSSITNCGASPEINFEMSAKITHCRRLRSFTKRICDLIEQHEVDWNNRLHFFSIAAEMMRRILVNYAIQRNAKKRGDGATKIALDEAVSFSDEKKFDLVALDDALKNLSEFDEKQARIVELRFFGGLTIEETAEVLEISDSTVKREWRMAKAWLKTQF